MVKYRTPYQGYDSIGVPTDRVRTIHTVTSDGITVSLKDPFMYLLGTSQETDIVSNPQITAGEKHGSVVSLQGTNNDYKVLLEDGSGLSLRASKPVSLGSGDIVNFIYDTANSVWQETSRGKLYNSNGEG